MRTALACAFSIACTLGFALPAHAFFGIGGLLNPEGSRLFPQTFLYPRHPGKPDLRWRSFDWKFVDVKTSGAMHRLYFYDEEEWAAQFTLPRIRNQVDFLTGVFNYTPSKRFDYLLFTSYREFQQANIFNISEGVQGITATTEASMAIPYWGETETFRHISTHEMVHQFQVQKVHDLAEYYAPEVLALIPLWFIEGMAEYYSQAGMDAEARMFIRDMVLSEASGEKKNKKEEESMKIPPFFDNGPMSFAYIYKLGQAKIHFLETKYGEGTSQKILETSSKKLARQRLLFDGLAAQVIGKGVKQIEKDWRAYLKVTYEEPAKRLSQSLADYERVEIAGDTLDLFDVSPDGRLMAVREIDPLTGVTAITLIDLKTREKKKVVQDQTPGTLSLFFMQNPTLKLGNQKIAYAVSTTSGPEIEFREIIRDDRKNGGKLELTQPRRIPVHEKQLLQITSLALSPKEDRLAFVGLTPKGWQNLYTVHLKGTGSLKTLKQLTDDYYSWKTPFWSPSGQILISSDRTDSTKYSLYSVDPDSGKLRQLTSSTADQLHPEVQSEPKAEIHFQSWADETSQIHSIRDGKYVRLTDVQTGVMMPRRRGKDLYVLGFLAGRYRVYKVPPERIMSRVTDKVRVISAKPWEARVLPIPVEEIGEYRPFLSSGTRLENIFGFFGTGNVGGVAATVTDLMRNYSFTGELSVLGDFRQTNLNLFLSSQKGRSTWVAGGYHIIQPRLDNVFLESEDINTFLHREFGALGAVQYPLGAFSYLDAGMRVGGVKRSGFSDNVLESEWEAFNPGVEFMAAPTLRLGYDRVMYELFSGPLRGFGVLLESDTAFYPKRSSVTERLRLDVSYYIQAIRRSVVAFHAVAGGSWGGNFRNPFFVSSDDILRAYPFGDERLLGNYVLAAKAEFRFPIGSLFGFHPLRGLLAYDYGTVYRRPGELAEGLTSSTTGGLSLNIPPLSINLMLSFPGITAPGPRDSSVFHFTLRYLYL